MFVFYASHDKLCKLKLWIVMSAESNRTTRERERERVRESERDRRK